MLYTIRCLVFTGRGECHTAFLTAGKEEIDKTRKYEVFIPSLNLHEIFYGADLIHPQVLSKIEEIEKEVILDFQI